MLNTIRAFGNGGWESVCSQVRGPLLRSDPFCICTEVNVDSEELYPEFTLSAALK